MVGSTGNNICLVATSIVSLAGIFITFIRRKNRKKRSYSSVSKITYPWKLTLGDYAWVGDEVNLYTLGEITIGAHSVISQKVIYAPGATTMQVNISPLTPRLL
ncbi:putative colanic acid biosynthesis acetyltransferase WcaF [Escherichia coli ECA-727]|nr:putative colanic acid biosynthesis acetyltransferase WcaF [Escherichia coli ECA-727]